MRRNKITQRQAIFYQLYDSRAKDPEKYIPIWQLIGEVYVTELGKWGFVSYEVSARMSELWSMNPNLFERKQVTGKSGAKYYAYRIALGVKPEDIRETDLVEFYKKIKRYRDYAKATEKRSGSTEPRSVGDTIRERGGAVQGEVRDGTSQDTEPPRVQGE